MSLKDPRHADTSPSHVKLLNASNSLLQSIVLDGGCNAPSSFNIQFQYKQLYTKLVT